MHANSKNTRKLRTHLHQFHNTCELQLLTTPPIQKRAAKAHNKKTETRSK